MPPKLYNFYNFSEPYFPCFLTANGTHASTKSDTSSHQPLSVRLSLAICTTSETGMHNSTWTENVIHGAMLQCLSSLAALWFHFWGKWCWFITQVYVSGLLFMMKLNGIGWFGVFFFFCCCCCFGGVFLWFFLRGFESLFTKKTNESLLI